MATVPAKAFRRRDSNHGHGVLPAADTARQVLMLWLPWAPRHEWSTFKQWWGTTCLSQMGLSMFVAWNTQRSPLVSHTCRDDPQFSPCSGGDTSHNCPWTSTIGCRVCQIILTSEMVNYGRLSIVGLMAYGIQDFLKMIFYKAWN